MKYSTFEKLMQNSRSGDDIELLREFPSEQTPLLLNYLRKSRSQLRQDLFVLSQLDFKTNGFFVEFGATNGVDLSNTHLLEKEFRWTGILAEPAKCWHGELRSNRNAHIETSCVWTDSCSTLTFNEARTAELSTIKHYSGGDLHKQDRKQGKTYRVNTISLNDLLLKYRAPSTIDYLSIDTEGSEFEILKNFNFDKYSVQVITCEHNYTPMRERISVLLSEHGYTRKYEKLSKFDDWYVKSV
jgi:FkbM family methyltransferase